jgi:uncharacterized protein (AIM24 family)
MQTSTPARNTEKVSKNSTVTSSGNIKNAGITSGQYTNLGAKIVNLSGYDTLQMNMEPNASFITNQETMSYMDGGLVTEAGIGSGGIFGAFLRGTTGASVLQNTVSNPTSNTLKIVLSPLIQGSIVQIDILPGETWRFADKSFMACTPNLSVSGNINIFSNFRMMFVGENLTYTTVTADKGTPGTVWVTAYGGVEKHEVLMGTSSHIPLYINNGCFLGMLENNGAINFWNDYVSVGTANGLFSAMFTQLGFVMKIEEKNPPVRAEPTKCIVLTQSLNPQNMEKYISHIVTESMKKIQGPSGTTFLTSGQGPTAAAPIAAAAPAPFFSQSYDMFGPSRTDTSQPSIDFMAQQPRNESRPIFQGGRYTKRNLSNKKKTIKNRL